MSTIELDRNLLFKWWSQQDKALSMDFNGRTYRLKISTKEIPPKPKTETENLVIQQYLISISDGSLKQDNKNFNGSISFYTDGTYKLNEGNTSNDIPRDIVSLVHRTLLQLYYEEYEQEEMTV